MRSLVRSRSLSPCLSTFFTKLSYLLLPTTFSTTTSSPLPPSPPESNTILSDQELSDIHHLLPALCDAGHPLEAVRLLDAALLANPPLSSLPLPELADRLSNLPDMSACMALLTSLRFHPHRPSPLPFCALFISSYFRRQRLREAAKVFAWLCRADSPCRPDTEVCRIAVRGFCEGGRAIEAVRVVREMAREGVLPTEEIRILLCLALLREARVQEGLNFDDAVRKVGEGKNNNGDGIAGITELLDRMIKDWED
ncbi:uncharacterized protein LOC110019803 [Phalaenopsis equestris]|uniref:uncharacterized protein LOC110019803 n=1 Tax=Phalaenopsis equestris TaxID=78828 RepID=UPI0009E37970|nr:uncharacterized protein LOC110019803 [Phalaenopsis equestris]XP_020573300.1 uncharacterized protein LOC110019803 [Phalaenopsis equestris]